MSPYLGTIIAESLTDRSVLGELSILSTKTEAVTARHRTPWLRQWTLHKVEISADRAQALAERLSVALQPDYWYADYKNDQYHYIVYSGRIFQVDRQDPVLYREAKAYGIALGIPEYQVDFKVRIVSDNMRVWDIKPQHLCRKHLLAEHRELHGLWNILTKHGGKGGYSRHPETLRWAGRLKALYLRHEALIKEFRRRGYRHLTPLDKRRATGSGSQSVFINSRREQKLILRDKDCECFSGVK